ncbi:MAG: hypothetical protein DIU82_03255 [Bacillota bacterium]|nr:MAG: hypothetical protein DIU82_03255 [Bacillota bacterium]
MQGGNRVAGNAHFKPPVQTGDDGLAAHGQGKRRGQSRIDERFRLARRRPAAPDDGEAGDPLGRSPCGVDAVHSRRHRALPANTCERQGRHGQLQRHRGHSGHGANVCGSRLAARVLRQEKPGVGGAGRVVQRVVGGGRAAPHVGAGADEHGRHRHGQAHQPQSGRPAPEQRAGQMQQRL